MVMLVSNIAIDHYHQSVTNEYREKKQPTMLSSAPTFVFASPPTFFGFAHVFFCFAPTFFVLALQILKLIT